MLPNIIPTKIKSCPKNNNFKKWLLTISFNLTNNFWRLNFSNHNFFLMVFFSNFLIIHKKQIPVKFVKVGFMYVHSLYVQMHLSSLFHWLLKNLTHLWTNRVPNVLSKTYKVASRNLTLCCHLHHSKIFDIYLFISQF